MISGNTMLYSPQIWTRRRGSAAQYFPQVTDSLNVQPDKLPSRSTAVPICKPLSAPSKSRPRMCCGANVRLKPMNTSTAAMRASRPFLNQFAVNADGFDAFIRDGLAPWSTQFLKVHELLDATLGIEH